MNMILIFMILPYENIVHIRHVFAMYSSTKKYIELQLRKNRTKKMSKLKNGEGGGREAGKSGLLL